MPRSPAVGLSCPLRVTNYCTTPYTGPRVLTTAFDMMVRVRLEQQPSAAVWTLIERYTSPNKSFRWTAGLPGSGAGIYMSTSLSIDGTGSTGSGASNVAPMMVGWLRCTWRDSDNVCKFYTASDADEPTWVQLGADRTIPVVGPIWSGGSTDIYFGSGISPGALTMYRAIIRDGYDGAGSVVFDADFSRQQPGAASFTEDANGATVSLTQSSQPPTISIVGRGAA